MNFGRHQFLAYCCTFICEIDVEIDSGKTNTRGVWEYVCMYVSVFVAYKAPGTHYWIKFSLWRKQREDFVQISIFAIT